MTELQKIKSLAKNSKKYGTEADAIEAILALLEDVSDSSLCKCSLCANEELDKPFGWICDSCTNTAISAVERTTLSGRQPEMVNASAPAPIDEKTGMHKDYWVLPEHERAKGFIRPVRTSYLHVKCGSWTTMNQSIAETYARNPSYYGSTFCASCGNHYPVGSNGEFTWRDGSKVGT